MATRVFSTQFISAEGVGSGGISYVVPFGYVAVVRDITVYSDTGFSDTHILVKNASTGATFFRSDAHRGTPTIGHLECRVVLDEDEELHAFTDGQLWDVSISGYLLKQP